MVKKSGMNLCSFRSDIGDSALPDNSSKESSSIAAGSTRTDASDAGRAIVFNEEKVGNDDTKASLALVTEYP